MIYMSRQKQLGGADPAIIMLLFVVLIAGGVGIAYTVDDDFKDWVDNLVSGSGSPPCTGPSCPPEGVHISGPTPAPTTPVAAAPTVAGETYTVSCAPCPDSFKHIAGDYEIIPSPDGKYNTCLVKGKYRSIYKRKRKAGPRLGQHNGLGELWLYAITETDGKHVGWMIGGNHKCEHSKVEAYVRIDTLDPANDTHAQISSAAGNWWLARNYASDYIGDPNWKHFPDLKIELKS